MVEEDLGLKDELDFNEETYAAKSEVEAMIANPSGDYATYTDVGEVISDILSEDDE